MAIICEVSETLMIYLDHISNFKVLRKGILNVYLKTALGEGPCNIGLLR